MDIRKSLSFVQGVNSYHVSNEDRIRLLTNSKCTSLYGPQGNVADKTVNSVKLLAEAHTNLIKTVSSINQEYLPKINVNTLSTDHIECLHSFSHRKRSFTTVQVWNTVEILGLLYENTARKQLELGFTNIHTAIRKSTTFLLHIILVTTLLLHSI